MAAVGSNLRRIVPLLCFAAAVPVWSQNGSSAPVDTLPDRSSSAEQLEIIPPEPAFDLWRRTKHVQAPDFAALPRNNSLPDPFLRADGSRVGSTSEWPAQREALLKLHEKYVWGRFPPRPKIDRVVLTDETKGAGYTTRNVVLRFGPGSRGSMRVRLVIPDGPGPFPVLLNCEPLGYAPEALRRGYLSAGFAGYDRMDDSASLVQLYPEYDFGQLPRRAWAASLVIDYLLTLPQVDAQRIAAYGYSRNGKMFMIAGARDTRISATVAASTGVGGTLPWRDAGERDASDGVESATRMFPQWYAPQLRFFTGREDRLPVDANSLAAAIAPRSLLMFMGTNDQVSSTWGVEHAFHSARSVYEFLGAPDRINTWRVAGIHGAMDIEACLDWIDIQFGRSHQHWTDNLLFAWDWNAWAARRPRVDVDRLPDHEVKEPIRGGSGRALSSLEEWKATSTLLHKEVSMMLGEAPPRMPDAEISAGGRRASSASVELQHAAQAKPDLPAVVSLRPPEEFGWLAPQKSLVLSKRVVFSGAVSGDLYWPKGTPAGARLPTVVWLHGRSYAFGYMWPYHEGPHPILSLVQAGYAVFAYDQSGFGSRQNESADFYERYPRWSRMGRLVEDVHAATDALMREDIVDPRRVILFGYSLGGAVALYAAASDPRISEVVSVAGFTPMRSDTLASGTGGVARVSLEEGLIPRLGYFVSREREIPYDFQDLLALLAPRRVLIVQPVIDRDAHPEDVAKAVESARPVYCLVGACRSLSLLQPADYNRLPASLQQEILGWMSSPPRAAEGPRAPQ